MQFQRVGIFVGAERITSYAEAADTLTDVAGDLVSRGIIPTVICRSRSDEAMITAAFLMAGLELSLRDRDPQTNPGWRVTFNGRFDANEQGAKRMAYIASEHITNVLTYNEGPAIFIAHRMLLCEALRHYYAPVGEPDTISHLLLQFELRSVAYLTVPFTMRMTPAGWQARPTL